MLTTKKEQALRELSVKVDGIVSCSDIESLAHGNDADFIKPFYSPAETEILDRGTPGTRDYRDWLEVKLAKRSLLIMFTEDFGEPGYTEGQRITLEVFEGWQTRVVAIPGVAERVELGWLQSFDIEVDDE